MHQNQQNQRLGNARRVLNFDLDNEEEQRTANQNHTNEEHDGRTDHTSEIQNGNNNYDLTTELTTITDISDMNDYEKMKFMQRWNFDFENEVPLEGDWEWEKTGNAEEKLNHKEKVVACFSQDEKNKDI